MSYFFVDGNRNGIPAQALYVAADSPEAAQVRARQLGLEPTGVRPAKSLFSKVTPKQFFAFSIFSLILGMLFLFLERFGPEASRTPNSGTMLIVFALLPQALVQIVQLMRDRDSMESEIQQLRQRLTALEGTSRP